MMGTPIAFTGTLQLMDWSETKRGQKVVFEVMLDPEKGESEHPFKRFTSKNGKIAGQLFAAVLVEVDPATDQPKPATPPAEAPKAPPSQELTKALADVAKVPGTKPPGRKSHFPDGLCGLAVKWCEDYHFQLWLDEVHNAEFAEAAMTAKSPDDQAKLTILYLCGIKSRKELDSNEKAAATFREKIMDPYKERRKEDGVDEEHF